MKFSTVFLAACSLRRASSYLVAPPGTPAPGAADNCSKWIQQSYGLSCAIIERIYGMTEAQLVAWVCLSAALSLSHAFLQYLP